MKEVRTALETMGELMEKAYQEDAKKTGMADATSVGYLRVDDIFNMDSYNRACQRENELHLAMLSMKRREHEARCFLAAIVAMLAVVIGVIVATLV